MEIRYSFGLVLFSIAVAIFASFVALNLVQSVTQAYGRARQIWLACGALAMGVGIWSMHFIGMLAFEMPGMEMAYDVPLMVLSVIVAVGASGLALYVVSIPTVTTKSLAAAGTAMAAAIAGMHYIGMYSMRMSARIEWNIPLVVLSVVIALVASFSALNISLRLRYRPDRIWFSLLASILMGAAIAGMHYTGMVAAEFVHDDTVQIKESNLLVSSGLTVAVILTTIFILMIALASSIGQRLFSYRQRQTSELQERESQLRSITNALPILVAQLDAKERVRFANSFCSDWFGVSQEAIRGMTARQILGPERYAIAEPHIRKTLAGETVTYERHSDFDGRMATFSITFVPELGSDRKVTGFVMIATDVSKYKEIELELKNAKQAADVANETKSAFLANMSHEIRTPLGAVIGFSELLVSDEMSDTDRARTVETIRRNGKLLSSIINDILDLSKVEAGKLDVERVEIPLLGLLNEVAVLLNLEATAKGIHLDVSSEGVIPTAIKTDPTRLKQILINIVGNAIKFTAKGSVHLKVKLAADDNRKLKFVVTDTGVGIAAEQVERLFAPFTQADATMKRKFGGTGLGLVLAKKLANALGGDVALVKSELGKGSTFVVTIDHGQNQGVIFQSKPVFGFDPKVIDISTRDRSKRLSNTNVLIVDDSPDNLALIQWILGQVGARVSTASNGKEGVEKAANGNFDVVLMDLQMPEMDGYEATRELRRRGFTRPIIALTAHAMKEVRERCLKNGFDDHCTKPIDRDSLIDMVAGHRAQA